MLRQKTRLVSFLLYFLDQTILLLSFYLSYLFRNSSFIKTIGITDPFYNQTWLLLIILPVWSLLFYFSRLYESQRTRTLLHEIRLIFITSAIGTLFIGFLVFAIRAHSASRFLILTFGFFSFLLLSMARILIREIARIVRKKGFNFRAIVIVGTGKRAREIAKSIERNGHWGLKFIGFVSDIPSARFTKIMGLPVLGLVEDLTKIIDQHVIDEVVFAVSRKRLENLEESFLICEEEGINARVAVNFFPHMIAKVHLEDLHGIPLLTFSTVPYNEFLLLIKRIMDVIVSTFLIVALIPIYGIIVFLIKISSPGPVFFKQIRVGRNGRHFGLYKFRSMVINAEEQKRDLAVLNEMDGPVFKIKNDPRITSMGKWLRKTSLDEIPQFWNVLVGEMSLVGPRPPLPEEVAHYKRWQKRKLSMKPGITCLWQISGRNRNINFEEWMNLDLKYIDNWSLKLDMEIFLKTIPVVLWGRGAF
ncbi:MAG: sugar transferase [Nitrospirae bacterium]|nr:sugar transferase [Nitrospirota bacterium]MBI3593472.1 sugar transferase [Nitrospirota bacterium]